MEPLHGRFSESVRSGPLGRVIPTFGGLPCRLQPQSKTITLTKSSGWSGVRALSFDDGFPWFIRGGDSVSAVTSGVESISYNAGGVHGLIGFRGGYSSSLPFR